MGPRLRGTTAREWLALHAWRRVLALALAAPHAAHQQHQHHAHAGRHDLHAVRDRLARATE